MQIYKALKELGWKAEKALKICVEMHGDGKLIILHQLVTWSQMHMRVYVRYHSLLLVCRLRVKI